MNKGAILSECGNYRYQLWRIWDGSKPKCLFVMHNPSTADEIIDDPTIRRCIGFAKSWGFGGFYVGNLSPYRATHPKDMKTAMVVLSPMENLEHIKSMIELSSVHILAHGKPIIKEIMNEFDKHGRDLADWHYLKLTKDGHPCHPLYLKKDLTPIKNHANNL